MFFNKDKKMGVLSWFKDWRELNKRIARSFKKRDSEISLKASKEEFKELRADTEKNKLELAQIKGALAVLMSKSQSQVSPSLKKSQDNFETKIIRKIKRAKKKAISEEIKRLLPSMSIIDIKNLIVDEKHLCSKASFYRYVSSLKSQKLIETETKAR